MIYLDHAATSHPKPEPVLAAVQRWFREVGVSAQRGDSGRCGEAAAIVEETRGRIGAMCGVPAQRVAFTSGATESLNLFLRSFLARRDRVVATATEHSSVVRPLTALREPLELDIAVTAPDELGYVAHEQVARDLVARPTRLLVLNHASNVLGSVQDAEQLCALAHRHGAAVLLDASQTAGLWPLTVGADAIAASAHKSLLAPPGLGFLAVRPELTLTPAKWGGTGSAHALESQPEDWPAAMEAGTPNTPAVYGLHAALHWLAKRAPRPLDHGLALVDRLRSRLERVDGVRVLGPRSGDGPRVPVLSWTAAAFDPAELGALLAEAGIHVRSGFHCAPWLHRHIGTEETGTVRASPGPFVRADDIDRAAEVLEAVLGAGAS